MPQLNKPTALKSIRQHCLKCMGNWHGVKHCSDTRCDLYDYREGHDPARAGKGGNPTLRSQIPHLQVADHN